MSFLGFGGPSEEERRDIFYSFLQRHPALLEKFTFTKDEDGKTIFVQNEDGQIVCNDDLDLSVNSGFNEGGAELTCLPSLYVKGNLYLNGVRVRNADYTENEKMEDFYPDKLTADKDMDISNTCTSSHEVGHNTEFVIGGNFYMYGTEFNVIDEFDGKLNMVNDGSMNYDSHDAIQQHGGEYLPLDPRDDTPHIRPREGVNFSMGNEAKGAERPLSDELPAPSVNDAQHQGAHRLHAVRVPPKPEGEISR